MWSDSPSGRVPRGKFTEGREEREGEEQDGGELRKKRPYPSVRDIRRERTTNNTNKHQCAARRRGDRQARTPALRCWTVFILVFVAMAFLRWFGGLWNGFHNQSFVQHLRD